MDRQGQKKLGVKRFGQPTRTAIPAKNRLSLPPISFPLSMVDAFGSKQGGLAEQPLSPLEAPTVCHGAQGAQWALVNAFQESGSREGGGEAEGGLTLGNTARSRDSHGSRRAKHEMPTNKKTNTLNKRKGFWSEHRKHWGTHGGSKQWQETYDAIVQEQWSRRWRDLELIKVRQIDYIVCVYITG